jgi:hypothetical protein
MKKLILILLVMMSSNYCANAQQKNQKEVLRHVVLFGWKEGTDPVIIDKIVTAFGELKNKIKVIKEYEWGINSSPENLNNGLSHCFTITFTNEADRDAYLMHPDHKAFVALLNPAPEKITVVDYWAFR